MTVLPSFPKVHFDFGAISALGEELLAREIKRPLIITDTGLVEHGVLARLLDAVPTNIEAKVFDGIPPNPTIAGVEAACETYRAEGCDGVVALGGGSVLDSGKALRVVATHDGPLEQYLLDPGKITHRTAPLITIPTTSGTGAEITFGGGIHPGPNQHALGIRSPHVKPDVAICDPDLTVTLPPMLTAATGMDALGHCVEGFLSTMVNPPAEAIALDGINRAARFVERASRDGNDREARWEMMMAALQGGMSIYMGLGPVHSLAHAFGDSPLHHGALVTTSIPTILRFFEGQVGDKLDRIGEAMELASGTGPAAGVAELNAKIGIPATVRELGYPNNDVDAVAQSAFEAHFNNTSPKKPSLEEYRQIVSEVLG